VKSRASFFSHESSKRNFRITNCFKFAWGSATSAYQTEGAWNVHGKGESIWDNYSHRAPCWYMRNQTGDVACDSYHNFDDDLAIIKELGLTHYRFSLSWSRLFPDGKLTSGPLPDGVRYYNDVINKLIAANVEPMVTLFHWDLPQALQDEFGGFNSSKIILYYVDYADFCFSTFGDRIKYWITFNAPYEYCTQGHGSGTLAPVSNGTRVTLQDMDSITWISMTTHRLDKRKDQQNGWLVGEKTQLEYHLYTLFLCLQNITCALLNCLDLLQCFVLNAPLFMFIPLSSEKKQKQLGRDLMIQVHVTMIATNIYGTCCHYSPGEGVYYAAHSIIKSHAQAYHIYNNTYRESQKGQIGITLNSNWADPMTRTDLEHVEASQRNLAFATGWFADPIFGTGDYPDIMRYNVQNISEFFNITHDRLPKFTEAEKLLNKGTSDFFGLNHYTSHLVVPCSYYQNLDGPTYDSDQVWLISLMGISNNLTSTWLYQVPWGIRKLLIWIKRTYGDPVIYITENGISEHFSDGLDDDIRVNYYKNYINEVLKAIKEDDVNVKGYTAWSLMDNFEWAEGYSERFGLHWVNFTDPERTRIPKKSASYY
uniref:beta-glucosidase n=1 Tax=Ciona savignyi TaxID=51511 RepID=H2YY91_CIOSA